MQLVRVIGVAILLAAAWILWSGFFKPLLLGLGVFSVILTLYILNRMHYFGNETFAFRYSHRLFGFWLWLLKEIVTSSLHVTRVILRPNIQIEPQIIEIDVSQGDALDQALLGNSITLTPGSLALDVHQGRMLVHTLTSDTAESLVEGEMQRRVFALRES